MCQILPKCSKRSNVFYQNTVEKKSHPTTSRNTKLDRPALMNMYFIHLEQEKTFISENKCGLYLTEFISVETCSFKAAHMNTLHNTLKDGRNA